MHTVVITGLGTVNPLGNDTASTWAGLTAGRSGIRALEDEWAADLPVRFAGSVQIDVLEHLDRVAARRLDRSTQLALIAAAEAWHDAGYQDRGDVDPLRLGASIGTGIGGLHSLLGNWDAQRDKGSRRVSPYTVPMLMSNAPAANIGLTYGAKAWVHCPVSACASGNEAIADAVDQIRLGRCDVVLAGGAEAVTHPLPLAAFANMQALSRRNDDPEHASRPWDVDRDGFVLSEGAAVVVLESLEHATARGAKIYATLAGAGISNDSHDIVQPEPSGDGQSRAMLAALREADVAPRDVVHVNAHATSTPQGDVTEAHSIARALGGDVDHVVVTGTKSMTGHLLGGAGALETIATVQALRERLVPATINIETMEPNLPIDVARTNRELPSGDIAAVNNSFGFGGANVAVVVTTENANR